MKKSFLLVGTLGLLTAAGAAVGSERTWVENKWESESDIGNVTLDKDDKLIIDLGNTEGNKEVDVGAASISNGVIVEADGIAYLPGEKVINEGGKEEQKGSNCTPDDANASPLAYTYGALELANNANVKFSKSDSWSYVGTLALGNDATLYLDERSLAVTGVPYVSMGAGAEIKLGARKENDSTSPQGRLSFGASNQPIWDAVVVKGAHGSDGYIRNTSGTAATLGTETAANVEYHNVVLQVQGDEPQTPIVAKMSNAAIMNQCLNDGEIIVSGGTAADNTTAVTQISTGVRETYGGNVTLLNRGDSTQIVETLLIGSHKVTAKQGGAESQAAVIQIDAYDATKRYDFGGMDETPGLVVWAEGAQLDADLMLGLGDVDKTVYFHNYCALDMCGNDVTLNSGILIYAYHLADEEVGTEVLLFSNVDVLTLGSNTYDGSADYFDYTSKIAAATYFSSSQKTSQTGLLVSVNDLTTNDDGSVKGWFIEYRDNNKNDGTGDVYLTYNVISAASDNVPEPTTATLSLLALAALAARRRRK